MAMGFIYHLLHSFPDCFSSVVARNSFPSPIRYACVFGEASKTRVKVAHYRKFPNFLLCRIAEKGDILKRKNGNGPVWFSQFLNKRNRLFATVDEKRPSNWGTGYTAFSQFSPSRTPPWLASGRQCRRRSGHG
jgi:hypothetical protein